MDRFETRRLQMVARDIAPRGIRRDSVLAAMRSVPRHEFVPLEYADLAYEDTPLPIGEGQTISQPYMVAVMVEALELVGTERVLEIGTGSGYGAAVLGQLSSLVWTVERFFSLSSSAARTLGRLGFSNVTVVSGDGAAGWPIEAPYDAIVVTAAPERIPAALYEQLADGGRMVVPVGPQADYQQLMLVRRLGDRFESEPLAAVRFVPLVG